MTSKPKSKMRGLKSTIDPNKKEDFLVFDLARYRAVINSDTILRKSLRVDCTDE